MVKLATSEGQAVVHPNKEHPRSQKAMEGSLPTVSLHRLQAMELTRILSLVFPGTPINHPPTQPLSSCKSFSQPRDPFSSSSSSSSSSIRRPPPSILKLHLRPPSKTIHGRMRQYRLRSQLHQRPLRLLGSSVSSRRRLNVQSQLPLY